VHAEFRNGALIYQQWVPCANNSPKGGSSNSFWICQTHLTTGGAFGIDLYDSALDGKAGGGYLSITFQ
jgi:hypothetical protein